MSSITREQPTLTAEQAIGREAPVSLATRVATILISGELIFFAVEGDNQLPELGIAFIFAGTLLATPSLIEPLVASRRFFAVYLRIVTMIAAIGVVLAVLAVRGGHVSFKGHSWLEVGVIFVVAIAEITLLLLTPLWIWKATQQALSHPEDQSRPEPEGFSEAEDGSDEPGGWRERADESQVPPKSRTWHACIEDKPVFAQLGALLGQVTRAVEWPKLLPYWETRNPSGVAAWPRRLDPGAYALNLWPLRAGSVGRVFGVGGDVREIMAFDLGWPLPAANGI